MDLGDRLGTLRFLIHDRDPVFTTAFGEVFKAEGLRIITTLPKTPRMNAVCERVNGTLRRELPDRILIIGERHLTLVPGEYMSHYNGRRPHQSRRQRPPDGEAQPARDLADLRSVRRKRVVAGVINEYHHAALPQLRPRNSIFERHTLRRELLDRMLILGEAHLRIILAEYQVHYNTARPHQGIAQRVPVGEYDGGLLTVADLDRERIHRRPVLGGLINEYSRVV